MTDPLFAHATAVALRSHAPYSGNAEGVALRLADGRWVAAPRLENAAYPLTIPAVQGAWALAALAGSPIAEAVGTRAFTPGETAFLNEAVGAGADASGANGLRWAHADDGPRVSFAVDPSAQPFDAVADAARRAVVPASDFRVGAVVSDGSGRRVWGANVEHLPDWTRGLCAERVALVAAAAEGLGPPAHVWLACASLPAGCSPCGGCRQVLAELAAQAHLHVGRGDQPARLTTPEALLPGAFGGTDLQRSHPGL